MAVYDLVQTSGIAVYDSRQPRQVRGVDHILTAQHRNGTQTISTRQLFVGSHSPRRIHKCANHHVKIERNVLHVHTTALQFRPDDSSASDIQEAGRIHVCTNQLVKSDIEIVTQYIVDNVGLQLDHVVNHADKLTLILKHSLRNSSSKHIVRR